MTWNWAGAAEAWADCAVLCPVPKVIELIRGFHNTLGENDVMAYLVMMAPRLYHLWRVLKPTGSQYLHCDPTASHSLKLLLDGIFGARNFKNEIIWKRRSAHSSAKRYGPVHDVILFYSKGDNFVWNKVHTAYDESYVKQFYKEAGEDGRRYTLGDLTGSEMRNGETGKIWRGVDVTKWGRHWMVSPADLDILDASGTVYWPPNVSVIRRRSLLRF